MLVLWLISESLKSVCHILWGPRMFQQKFHGTEMINGREWDISGWIKGGGGGGSWSTNIAIWKVTLLTTYHMWCCVLRVAVSAHPNPNVKTLSCQHIRISLTNICTLHNGIKSWTTAQQIHFGNKAIFINNKMIISRHVGMFWDGGVLCRTKVQHERRPWG